LSSIDGEQRARKVNPRGERKMIAKWLSAQNEGDIYNP
jgi:hypothetical protein